MSDLEHRTEPTAEDLAFMESVRQELEASEAKRRSTGLGVLRAMGWKGLVLALALVASLGWALFGSRHEDRYESGRRRHGGGAAAAAVMLMGAIAMLWRAKASQHHVKGLEEGKVCLRCDSERVTLEAGIVECNACGFRKDLESIKALKVNAKDLEGIHSEPPRRD